MIQFTSTINQLASPVKFLLTLLDKQSLLIVRIVFFFFFFFFSFPNLFAICRDAFSKWCVGKRGWVEECSVAPLRNKKVKNLCGCREQRVQTKEKYKLSYNYINYTINLVGRSFDKWRRRRLRSGGSKNSICIL
jgi:hypothetical protein